MTERLTHHTLIPFQGLLILAAARSCASGSARAVRPSVPSPPSQSLFSASFLADGVFGRCQEFPAMDVLRYEVSPGVLQHLTATLQKLSRTGGRARHPRPPGCRGGRERAGPPARGGQGAGGLGPSWAGGCPGSCGRCCGSVKVDGWPRAPEDDRAAETPVPVSQPRHLASRGQWSGARGLS